MMKIVIGIFFCFGIILSNFTFATDKDIASYEEVNLKENIIDLYTKAKLEADKGDGEKKLKVFLIFYETYPALESKLDEAAKYLTEAAISGNMDAQYNMGYLQQVGEVFYKDTEKSLIWLSRAAEQGHILAHRQIGFLFLEKYHLNNDVETYKTAKNWFLKGASLGDVASMRQVGLGIIANEKSEFDEALAWLEQAYINNDSRAARYLGQFYYLRYQEKSNLNDREIAIEWYVKAAALGDSKSIEWLKENQ